MEWGWGEFRNRRMADQEVKRAGNGVRYRVRLTHGGEEENEGQGRKNSLPCSQRALSKTEQA